HVVPPRLDGVGTLGLAIGDAGVAESLQEAMAASGVTRAFALGCIHGGDDDPLGVTGTQRIAQLVPGLHAVGVADPAHNEPAPLKRVEAQLQTGQVHGLMVYLGYLPFPPDHPGYLPYYDLAQRFKVPVMVHTGDPYCPSAKVRYCQPLLLDDLAVDWPDV